jgi:hypothetical protein
MCSLGSCLLVISTAILWYVFRIQKRQGSYPCLFFDCVLVIDYRLMDRDLNHLFHSFDLRFVLVVEFNHFDDIFDDDRASI